jgi:hypothetical protein
VPDTLLSASHRDRLREFAVAQELDRPGLLGYGAKVADQLRTLLPSLDDETMAAVVAVCADLAGHHARAAGCGHVHRTALLLQAAVVDLAHLELDAPP